MRPMESLKWSHLRTGIDENFLAVNRDADQHAIELAGAEELRRKDAMVAAGNPLGPRIQSSRAHKGEVEKGDLIAVASLVLQYGLHVAARDRAVAGHRGLASQDVCVFEFLHQRVKLLRLVKRSVRGRDCFSRSALNQTRR